jgi:prephenate dehydratase
MTVAFQGRPGANSEIASIHLYSPSVEIKPCDFFEDVFQSVKDGSALYGVIPVENSTTGSVYENYDLMLQFRLSIVAEVKLKIEHFLLAPHGVALTDLKQVHSHPQALAQCNHFFKAHPKIMPIPSFDTAGAAELLKKDTTGTTGAIASRLAAEEYDLNILASNIENNRDTNYTRFLSIHQKPLELGTYSGPTKTSIIFIPNQNHAGVLYEVLEAFARRKVNLLRIESRPKPKAPWSYIFYLDLEGDTRNPHIMDALQELDAKTDTLVLLGSYPVGKDETLINKRKS